MTLGPGGTVLYSCRNMTMEAFAAGLRGMYGSPTLPNPALDQTGIEGTWNFDVKWSIGNLDSSGRVDPTDAIDKQLGLKLEQRQLPVPVIVVEGVNRSPTPDVSSVLPFIPPPTEFEIADVKLSDPAAKAGLRMPPGRLELQGYPMNYLLMIAFGTNTADQFHDHVAMPPKFQEPEGGYAITAKLPADAPQSTNPFATSPMMLSLLKDRFKLAYHTEDRPVSITVLAANGKPKMKPAVPSSRTHCLRASAPPGSSPGSFLLTCQNIAMAEFAAELQILMQNGWPVEDSTGLEGRWDFSFVFTPAYRVNTGPAAAEGAASDPNGSVTLPEAVEKLGLKLEQQKRPMPVIVIDHLEQQPTEN